MKDVFISYTTPDLAKAEDLVAYLENHGINCFIAPRDVTIGKPYASCLMQAMDEASVIVLICSEAINDSVHVLNEVETIVKKRKSIIPFVIENFTMSDELCYYLSRTQHIVAYPDAPSAYYGRLLTAITPYLPEREEPKPAPKPAEPTVQNTTTVFEYHPDRGIMINPEDHQRNVSFRTDTFISMFGGIFDHVVELSGLEQAKAIFHDTGYTSGRNFAQRLNSSWEFAENGTASIEGKLRKWCDFDSNVGWGKFDIDVTVDAETGDFEGILTINECFIVDRKSRKQICEFIRGYCEGVIETLLCVDVVLECIECPMKNRFKPVCKFRILLRDPD